MRAEELFAQSLKERTELQEKIKTATEERDALLGAKLEDYCSLNKEIVKVSTQLSLSRNLKSSVKRHTRETLISIGVEDFSMIGLFVTAVNKQLREKFRSLHNAKESYYTAHPTLRKLEMRIDGLERELVQGKINRNSVYGSGLNWPAAFSKEVEDRTSEDFDEMQGFMQFNRNALYGAMAGESLVPSPLKDGNK